MRIQRKLLTGQQKDKICKKYRTPGIKVGDVKMPPCQSMNCPLRAVLFTSNGAGNVCFENLKRLQDSIQRFLDDEIEVEEDL